MLPSDSTSLRKYVQDIKDSKNAKYTETEKLTLIVDGLLHVVEALEEKINR